MTVLQILALKVKFGEKVLRVGGSIAAARGLRKMSALYWVEDAAALDF